MKKLYKQDYWKKRFVFYHFINLTHFQIESLHLAHLNAGNRGTTFLDLGCGDGRFLFEYYSEKRLHPQVTTVSLDVSYDALVTTKQSVYKTIPVQGDALQLPFKKYAFDLVQCSMLIEQVPDVTSSLCTFPNSKPRRSPRPGHEPFMGIQEYTEITDLLTHNGFNSYDFRYYTLKMSAVRRLIM